MQAERQTGLVSVILPTYNRADRIERAIDSVVCQTYANWELIVIDDASRDDTVTRVQSLSDPRICLIRQPVNGGVEAARNVAIEQAQGEFIAFLDDDDVWLPDKLRRQVELMQAQPHFGLVHAGVVDVFPDGRRLVRLPPRGANSYKANLVRDCIATSSVMVRADVFDRLGLLDASLGSFGDWEMWRRIMRDYPISSLDEPLVIAEQSPNSITHGNVDEMASFRWNVLQRLWDDVTKRGLQTRALAFHDAYVAGLMLVAGRRQEARSLAFRSLLKRPSIRAGLVFSLSLWGRRGGEEAWKWLQGARRRLRA